MQGIDINEELCYYTTMENMKIYINGQYSVKENLKFKAKMKGPVILKRLDDAWNKLYEL